MFLSVLHLVSTVSGVHVLREVEVGAVFTGVLPGLHLAVDHTRILPLLIHMVHLCQVCCILGGGDRGGAK